MQPYQGMAEVYDRLMSDVDYDGWFEFVHGQLKERGVERGRLCDAACGTGEFSLRFARAGYDVVGVDMCEAMLARAQEKARAAGLAGRVAFVRQDMRSLALPGPFDAVISMCDGVNYLAAPKDVERFFTCAAAGLRQGGAFVFDVSSRYKLEHVLGDNHTGYDDGECAYLWQNSWDEARAVCAMDLIFFVRRADGRYSRFDERHIQRGHAADELALWLEGAGFSRTDVYGDRAYRKPLSDEKRIFFVSVKG